MFHYCYVFVALFYQVLRPEDMINPNIDDLSMMTYLSAFPKAKLKPGAPLRPKSNAKKVENVCKKLSLFAWRRVPSEFAKGMNPTYIVVRMTEWRSSSYVELKPHINNLHPLNQNGSVP